MSLKTKPNAKTAAANKATTLKGDHAEKIGGRPVLFPKVTVCGIEIPRENLLVTAEDAKTFLGWESESDYEARLTEGASVEQASKMNVKYGNDFDFKDYNGEKVRLKNNVRNRPVDLAWVQQIAVDILNEFWRFNGESWIIGQTGLSLSLQHRALGLIWAEQKRSYEGNDEEKKALAKQLLKAHPEPLAIEAVVVRGVEETPDVTRTMDNVRPRSLSDVLFADTSNFANTKRSDREALCKLTDFAIRTVQARTGENEDAFAPRRSHSEPLEFLGRHPRIIKAVNHIFTEVNRSNDKGEKVSVLGKVIGAGTAAGLMFLMGASKSDRKRWDDANPAPTDRHLDFEMWDKAEEFWAGLGDATNKEFEGIRAAIAKCGNSATGAPCPPKVKTAIVVNGWNEFIADGGSMTLGNVMPEFGPIDDNGNRPLKGMPACSVADGDDVYGIDLGDPVAVRKAREEEEAEAAAQEEAEAQANEEPSVEEKAELAARAAEEKKKGLKNKAGK